jgi:hypothetical protein
MVNGPLPKMTAAPVALAGLGEEISNRIRVPQREVTTKSGEARSRKF